MKPTHVLIPCNTWSQHYEENLTILTVNLIKEPRRHQACYFQPEACFTNLNPIMGI